MFVLWEAHREQHDTTRDDISSGSGSTLLVPGHMVFALESPPPPPQDCVDHIHLRHQVGLSAKASNLGRFPPWSVTQTAWNAALKPKVSGVATDVMLFSQHGARLVHRYRVYRDVCATSLSSRNVYGSVI